MNASDRDIGNIMGTGACYKCDVVIGQVVGAFLSLCLVLVVGKVDVFACTARQLMPRQRLAV